MPQGLQNWSKTAATNSSADSSINWAEGQAPSSVNDSARAMMARIAEYRDDTSGLLLTTGTSTAYAVATNEVLPATPADGQALVVSFHTVNGTSATLAADGGTAFPLQLGAGSAVQSGGIDANTPVPLRFRAASGGAWVMYSAGFAATAASAVPFSITNSALANLPAWTIKGNATGGVAQPTDFTIDALTVKATPAAADEIPIWDAAAGAMKKALPFVTPTVQRFTSGSTNYTPTAGTVYIRVRMAAAGGGGSAPNTNAGANGSNSSFGGWTCVAGAGSSGPGNGGAGGSGGANGTGTLIARFSGGTGTAGQNSAGGTGTNGGPGGANPFGGAGGGGAGGGGSAGQAGVTNTGAGGGGGGTDGTHSGGGGGAGEYVEFYMTAPGVIAYTVGAGGNGGAAGTFAGGNGAAGIIIVEEFYI